MIYSMRIMKYEIGGGGVWLQKMHHVSHTHTHMIQISNSWIFVWLQYNMFPSLIVLEFRPCTVSVLFKDNIHFGLLQHESISIPILQ